MSNHGATATGTSLREYAAAEDRLLNYFSPLSAPEDGSTPPPTTDNVPASASVAAANLDPSENVFEVDPSRDSMVAFISDDTDLHSLLSSSGSSFKGFDDSMQDNEKGAGGDQSLIFGAFRNEENLDYHLRSDNLSTPERVDLSPQLSNAQVASTSGNYILTNGIESHEDKFEFEEQHVVIEASHADCVIYDDSMVLLTDDQCCEIIVQTDQEMERAYLMEVEQHQQQQQEQLLESPETLDNGVGYSGNDVEEMPRGEPHVYLSDAAMVLEQQQQQLLLDGADEETPQVSDSYVDDICEVYDDELEDHDDEHVIEEPHDNLQVQLQDQHEQGDTSILVVSDVEDRHHQKELPAVAVVSHSSTTEFPVSSTSMPNASDYDDYDADVGTAEEQSPPHPRKYNLLKNTLSAEAMDRRLANICQSQPQMSVNEKLANWNCAYNCDAVEDVENFDAEFDQHEAKPAVQPKFNEFYDKLRQSMTELKRDLMQRSASTDAPDTPYSSEDVAMQKRPNYRRLMQLQTESQTDPIVLDDDDDDDCIEVQVTPSLRTLVPDPEIQMTAPTTETVPEDDVIVKTMETQTMAHSLQSKQTSTADLSHQMPSKSMQECIKLTPMMQDAMLYEAKLTELKANSEEQQQRHSEQEQGQHKVLGNSVEYHNEAQFYQQHEFCNYLGLTELATANAVANAMRELANSTVARRSLRVRTQQQLDRMRMDVRGKRRQREKHEQRDGQLDEQQEVQIQLDEKPLTSECNSSTQSHSHSHCSSNRHRKSLTLTGNEIAVVEMTSSHVTPPRISPATQTIEYYYHSPTGDVQHHPKALLTVNEANALSLEAAFAKVYAAAAPAQSDLHECMQHRLRQARETKPSIYIVKSMNNSAPSNSTSAVCSTPVAPTPERLKSKTPEPVKVPPKLARKSSKKTPQKSSTAMSTAKATKRRRTTAVGGVSAAATATSDRELITRSMNSKMLRNRKVNMLKTFELADMAHGRSKQRLSGGSTGNKRVVAKTARKTAKKTVPGSPLHQLVESGQQHRVEQQQQTPTKNTGTTKTARTPNRTPTHIAEPKAKKHKRFRAKSLPSAFNPEEQRRVAAGHESAAPVTPQMSPIQHHIAKPLTDTRECLRNPSLVSPPLYSAAVRRYVNAVRSPKEQVQQQHLNLNPSIEEEQHSQHPEGFFDLTGPYSRLAKPALTYPPLSPPPSQRAPHFSRRARQMAGSNVNPEVDKMHRIHMTPPGGILSLTKGSTALENPLAGKNGKVLYMFYELEQLIVLQERVITFWKYSKIFNVLQKPKPDESSTNATASQQHAFNIFGAKTNTVGNKNARRKSGESESVEPEGIEQRWVYLGGTRRTTNDMEVSMPFANRICAHNSTPVYIEMRSHQLDHHRRESKLLSLYVNVYYYCDEELRPKMHSVHLDAVNCEWNQVIYTSITESRYFVMAWQQEIVMGKPRAGICKYSLTPTLDTLASIREFKQLRHELKHIECLTEDRLIGYGLTRITIWDHRSGDTLMNYDLGFKLGRNLGVMHFPSFEMDQSSLLVLYQHVKEQNQWPELRIIACELSHATPSHRLLYAHRLPSPQFDSQLVAVNTGDHLILKAPSDDEIWISISDPRKLTYLAPQGTQRFYTRLKSQVIIVTPETLTVDSIANHVLQLATQHQQMMLMAAAEVAASTG